MLARRIADGSADLWFQLRRPPIGKSRNLDLEKAFAKGIEFILRNQRRDGAFVDFLLTPGASDTWITAHVAWILEEVPEFHLAHRRAAKYLYEIGIRQAGRWGYNGVVGTDSDSTAQALMVLQKAGYASPEDWFAALAATQHSNGGFSTFSSENPTRNGWQAPHPDVTLVVAESLRRSEHFKERQALAIKWIADLKNNGALHAYWWKSPGYILWAGKKAGLENEVTASIALRSLAECQTVPDLPMLLWVAYERFADSPLVQQGIAALVRGQLADGSWKCAPCLRLTAPAVMEAREEIPGTLHAGRRRLVSTAHSVALLSMVLQDSQQTKGT